MDEQSVINLLRSHGVDPDRARGQNFLLDEEVVANMAEDAKVTSDDLVVEIGPGLGVLTKQLIQRAKRVLAIELEPMLAQILRSILKKPGNLDVLRDDALSSNAFHYRVEWLAKQREINLPDRKSPEYQNLIQTLDYSYKIVANLPYQITSRALRTFLEDQPRPSHLTVMVQKEVAERATAPAGEMSLLSLSVQAYSEARISQLVPAASFHPRPAVDSAVLSCDLTKPHASYQALNPAERANFWRLAHAGFASRRKQLRNNLKNLIAAEKLSILFEKNGITPLARAQELTIEQWCALAQAIPAM